jgi:Cu+-exporting ATPase
MDASQILVTAGGALLVSAVLLYFFGPRKQAAAVTRGGVQEVEILVRGGYAPGVVRATRGRPLRLTFNRQEDNPCSDTVVLPDFRISRDLPAFQKTVVEFTPPRAGEFEFRCGMNMLHGKLVVQDK